MWSLRTVHATFGILCNFICLLLYFTGYISYIISKTYLVLRPKVLLVIFRPSKLYIKVSWIRHKGYTSVLTQTHLGYFSPSKLNMGGNSGYILIIYLFIHISLLALLSSVDVLDNCYFSQAWSYAVYRIT